MFRILLVDDESHFRFAAKMVLKKAGFRVIDCVNGEHALKALLEEKDSFDLLVMDIIMPKMSGIGLLDELIKSQIEIPVLAVSGIADREMVQELKRRGCENILYKPFEPHQLLRRVYDILGIETELMHA